MNNWTWVTHALPHIHSRYPVEFKLGFSFFYSTCYAKLNKITCKMPKHWGKLKALTSSPTCLILSWTSTDSWGKGTCIMIMLLLLLAAEEEEIYRQAEMQAKNMPLSVVRLSFRAYLHDISGMTRVLPPVMSNPIYDSSKWFYISAFVVCGFNNYACSCTSPVCLQKIKRGFLLYCCVFTELLEIVCLAWTLNMFSQQQQLLLLLLLQKQQYMHNTTWIFTTRRYAGAVYDVVMCPSIRPSICPSHASVVPKRLNVRSRR